MTEAADSSQAMAGASAGALLRAARERKGMTLAALAAAIKISPRKLDALEHDRLAELPDLTFARALAQTVCRLLRIDAEPVLALLPSAGTPTRRLESIPTGLNAPFDGEARRPHSGAAGLRRPVLWVAALLLLGAAGLLLGAPERLLRWRQTFAPAPAPAPSAAVPPGAAALPAAPATNPDAMAVGTAPVTGAATAAAETVLAPANPAVVVETVHSAPTGAAAASGPDAAPAGALQLRTSAESWVEVRDASGQLLLSRTLLAGEAVGVDGAPPLRATIGNAAATSVSFRGAAVDLTPATRDNIARLELK